MVRVLPNFAFVRLLLLLGWSLATAWTASSYPQRPASGPIAGSAAQEVVDEVGRRVRMPVSPARIVSLAPSLTETVYALGLQDRLVGDTDYCDYPPDAQKKTKVGGVINPNLEEIASLHPDLVLITKSINRLETVRALDTLGIPSYATDPHTVEDIATSTHKLADVLGVPDAGKKLDEEMHQQLAELQNKLTGVTPSRVLFIVWTEPLISIGQSTFIADALRRAGALSIVQSDEDWPQMSLEEVVRLQPEYLVFAESHYGSAQHDFEVLAARPGWGILQAVQNRRYATVSDAVNRPSPRIVSAIEDLAQQLHPKAFREAPAPAAPTVKDPVPAKPVSQRAEPSALPNAAVGLQPVFLEASCAR